MSSLTSVACRDFIHTFPILFFSVFHSSYIVAVSTRVYGRFGDWALGNWAGYSERVCTDYCVRVTFVTVLSLSLLWFISQ